MANHATLSIYNQGSQDLRLVLKDMLERFDFKDTSLEIEGAPSVENLRFECRDFTNDQAAISEVLSTVENTQGSGLLHIDYREDIESEVPSSLYWMEQGSDGLCLKEVFATRNTRSPLFTLDQIDSPELGVKYEHLRRMLNKMQLQPTFEDLPPHTWFGFPISSDTGASLRAYIRPKGGLYSSMMEVYDLMHQTTNPSDCAIEIPLPAEVVIGKRGEGFALDCLGAVPHILLRNDVKATLRLEGLLESHLPDYPYTVRVRTIFSHQELQEEYWSDVDMSALFEKMGIDLPFYPRS